ncbi:cyclic nucleotide-gated cation channel beta-1-like [Tachysurus ichikawai]
MQIINPLSFSAVEHVGWCQERSPVEKFTQEVEGPVEDPQEAEEELEDEDRVEEPSASPEPVRPEAFPAEEPEEEEEEEEESDDSSEAESEPEPITQQLRSCDGASVKQNVTQDNHMLNEEGTYDSTSYLSKSQKFPSVFPSVSPSFLSTSLPSPRNFPLSLKDFPAGFPTDFPNILRILLNTSPACLSAYLIFHIT